MKTAILAATLASAAAFAPAPTGPKVSVYLRRRVVALTLTPNVPSTTTYSRPLP